MEEAVAEEVVEVVEVVAEGGMEEVMKMEVHAATSGAACRGWCL